MKQLWLVLIGLVITAEHLGATPVYPLPDDIQVFSFPYEVFHDKDNALDLSELQKIPSSSFLTTSKSAFGYLKNNIWFRYDLKNESLEEQSIRLSFGAIDQTELKLFTLDDLSSHPQEIKQVQYFRTPTFRLDFKPQEKKQLIFHLVSSSHPVHVKHYLIPDNSWTSYVAWDTMYNVSVLGGFFAIFLYNVFLYLSLKDKTYIFYLVYGFFAGLLLISNTGYISLIFDDKSQFNMMDYQIFVRPLTSISAIIFAILFLESKKLNPKIIYFYWVFILADALTVVLGLFGRDLYEFSSSVISLAGLFIISDSIICYRRGKKPALFFLVGWGVLIVSIIIWTIHNYGVLNFEDYRVQIFIAKLPNVGIVFEMIFMSLALGAQIKVFIEQSVLAEEKANEAETMRQLIRILSHDVNTPIAVIKGSASICRTKATKERLDMYLGKIERSADKLIQINEHVRKLIALRSSKTLVELSPVDLKEVVEDCTMLFSDSLENKEIKLDIEDCTKGEKTLVLAEGISLGNEVLNNLISNAIKFSTRGSTIKLRIEEKRGKVIFSVKDSGVGIPKELIGVIFNPERPTHRKGTESEEGTGFGMPIVKTYIDAYGGTIEVESEDNPESPERGTTFKITLDNAS